LEAASPDIKKQGFLAVVFIIGNTAESPTRRETPKKLTEKENEAY